MGATGHGMYEVMLLDASQSEAAERVLKEQREEPRLEDEELEAKATPDLTKLDPRHLPRCPGCGAVLRVGMSMRCGCGREVDVEQLIVEQHGPEALAACYPDEPEQVPESLIESAVLVCPECQYPLESLPNDGICPECGTPYSKALLVQKWAGRL